MSSDLLIRESAGEIPTNYTRKYADTRGWKDWEIIREIVQNSLDAAGSAHIEKLPDSLIITDRGRGFNALNLLMGTTSKSKCERGRFGEGLKIAILAAMNMGYTVEIFTDSMHIMPQWRIIEVDDPSQGKMKAEIMVFKFEKMPPINGTKVKIIGYTSDDTYSDRFNLETNKKIVFKAETDICEGKKYSSYMIDEDYAKGIYVRNIFVQEIAIKRPEKTENLHLKQSALFSYDLFNVSLSTDRNIPSNYDIKTQIGRLWSYVSDPKLIERFFEAVDSEMYEASANLSSDTMSAAHTESAWRSGFKKHYGDNAFLRTKEDRTRLAEYHTHFRKKGVSVPDGIRGTLNAIGIQNDMDVLEQIKSVMPRSPISLSQVQWDNMEYLRMIHYKLKETYFKEGGSVFRLKVYPKVFLATKETMVGSDAKVLDGNIYINETRSLTMTEILDDYGHEMTHILYPELDDNTSAFYGKIGFVMATITKVIAVDMRLTKVPPNVVW